MTDEMEMNRIDPALANGAGRSGRVPMCYFCSSTDTMEPYARTDHVPVVSTLFPRLRLRYCRLCTRHFLAVVTNRSP